MAKRKLDITKPVTVQVQPSVVSDPASPPVKPKAKPKSRANATPKPPAIASPPPPEPQLELEDFAPDQSSADLDQPPRRRFIRRAVGVVLTLAVLYAASFELVHWGKIYPGVTADGLQLGGLTQAAAEKRLSNRATTFSGQVVTITENNTHLRIPVANLAPTYDAAHAAKLAYRYGRDGSFTERLKAHARAALGRHTVITSVKFDTARLVPYLTSLVDDVSTPVKNASLAFNDNQADVTPAQAGQRLNIDALGQAIINRLSVMSTEAIPAPIYAIAPSLDTASLRAAVGQINGYVAAPIVLEYSGTTREIDQQTIIKWINVGSPDARPFLASYRIEDLYRPPPAASLGLNAAAVAAYVTNLASGIDQTPQNAGISMQDNQLTIVQPSRTGIKLDQRVTIAAINEALKKTGERRIALKLDIAQADVNENNLNGLGIKELLSTGETYFPGSSANRVTNVRVGASKFNGVLLKPGETFSFGKLLGYVGPENGYKPELVILAKHEEKQYGGGLCQVSSTAFRAALAAGLPITQRVNHSFAISYYTWPYSAPGVDATIYYPSVDFKFVNDTGHYILMQTTMKGYSLKFDFYGTKIKTGTLRGPEFVTGSNDHTKPSHTVFYRDVKDLAGNVVKTDTFHTRYKSSLDFPIVQQFN
jgi:vancomycin resistance protein YoaR